MAEQIYLSRRNLLMLLAKLDRQAEGGSTACTIIKFQNPTDLFVQSVDEIRVTAVEDDVYYARRAPGIMHPTDEAAVARKLEPVEAHCYLREFDEEQRVYVGQTHGQDAREFFRMDEPAVADSIFVIHAEEDTYSISDSFWRGLLDDTLNKCANKDEAHRKLKFEGPSQFRDSFTAYIVRHFIVRGWKV